MYKISFIVLISLFGGAFMAQTTLSEKITINGQERTYRVYIPAIYDGLEHVPLVFNFHGYTSTNIEQEGYGDFRPIADTANFILVHPQGLNIGGGYGWNNFGSYDPNNYDYAFVSQLLDSLISTYKINTKRVYSTGMSNGGFMSYDLACFMSTRFAAVASVTGSMVSSRLNSCQPERAVPVMQIHGTNDATVSYNGGGSTGSVGIEALVQFWATRNNCDPIPTITQVPNTNTTDMSTAEHQVYSGGIQNHEVEFFKVNSGGHTWPGSAFNIPGLVTNQDFKATTEIWRFFSQYEIEEAQNGLKEEKLLDFLSENPVDQEIKLDNSELKASQITIVNELGQVKIQQTLESGANTVHCNHLAAGSYVYLLTDKNETVLARGKVIKR